MIVDTHAHIFLSNNHFTSEARYRPTYDATLEHWLALWPAADVTHGVLVQPSFLGVDNSHMLAALADRPGILRAVVVINPAVKKADLREWHTAGVRGVRLNLIGITDLSVFVSHPWKTVFSWMVELGWHLEVQCEGERLAGLFLLLKEVPLTLVIDHFGLPDPLAKRVHEGAKAILQEASKRSLLVKLSAPYRLRGAKPDAYAALFVSELGPENLMWGSDWPWTNHESGRSYSACLTTLSSWVSSPAIRKTILEETPKRLYGF